MSYGILIVAHGSLAESLRASIEHVLGEVPDLDVLGLAADGDLGSAQRQICDAAEALDRGGGVVVVTDLHGGSPCNAAETALRGAAANAVLLSGANIPMLLALARSRGMPLVEAAEAAIEAGQQYIQIRPVSGGTESDSGHA